MKFWGKKTAHDVVKKELEIFFPRLWRYCLALTGDRSRSDDLAQAACLRAIEKADKFKAGTHFDRWMFRLTQRLWINEIRKEAVRNGGGLSSIDEEDLVDTKPDPEVNLLGREVLLEVMRLPEAQRATLLLVYVEGYSYSEAANLLEIPIGTVMSRLAVARSKLVKKYGSRSEVG
jgi:RNA polymerase sigma-70 factor (ECF subfamily)